MRSTRGGGALNLSSRAGFTLAEVLITLGIIGVVAAMTMPSLIADHKKKETAVKVKKMYSLMAQAVQMSSVDNGDGEWDLGEVASVENAEKGYRLYVEPYFKVAKYCGVDKENCFPKEYFFLNKQKFSSLDIYVYFVLVDGTMVRLSNQKQDFGKCLAFTFDINGLKPPNTIGKDIFEIKAYSKGLYTAFIDSPREYVISNLEFACNKQSDKGGYACVTLMLKDGWEIRDDYPW